MRRGGGNKGRRLLKLVEKLDVWNFGVRGVIALNRFCDVAALGIDSLSTTILSNLEGWETRQGFGKWDLS